VSGITKGEEGRRDEPKRKGGIDSRKCGFPRFQLPPERGGAARDDGGLASVRSIGGPRGLGPVGLARLGGEYD